MIIDAVDIKATYGATLLEGGLKSLMSYPKLKIPIKNDWAEEDGLEVDLSAPVLDTRSFELSFHINQSNIEAFVTFIMAKTYRVYNITDLNYSFNLRCVEISDINKPQNVFGVKLKLFDDSPLWNYSYVAPALTELDFGFTLDGANISTYGLLPLDGAEMSLDEKVSTKKKLTVDSKFTEAVFVSETPSRKNEHIAKLGFLIRQTKADFLKGYNALFYDLIQSGERVLASPNTYSYICYYNGSRVVDLEIIDDVVYCHFELALNITKRELTV